MTSVIGIDLGTQHLKVVCYDVEARRTLAVESSSLDLYQSESGVAEQQAHWWVNALIDAFGKVDGKVRKTARAIGVSGQQHGFVPLDASGEVLAAVKLWCDTSTETECREIMEAFGGQQACIDEVGNAVLPGYTASKVRWFRNAHPALYSRMATILLPHDYINFYLTGERCMEMGDASGTGFLDVRTREWSQKMLAAIDPERDLQQCLPLLRSGNEPIGTLLPGIAATLGLPEGLPVSIGGGDNMMAAIGTGNICTGKITMSLGTSGTVYAYADTPIVDPKGNIAAFCSSNGGWLPLLCTMNCTVTTELMRGLLGADIADFEQRISRAPRGSGGAITIPFFNGERTPNLPNAKGCIVGLDSQNVQPDCVLRSAVEGATYALRFGVDELRQLGIATTEIILTGGGVRSAKWRQIVADICNVPVTVLAQDEGAAFGAALQALELLEPEPGLRSLAGSHLTRDEARCTEPRDAAVDNYEQSYRQYQKAVSAITSLYGD